MTSLITLVVLFFAKMTDNALSTTKTILIQRSRCILAGVTVLISDFIYFWITRRVVTESGLLPILIVSLAGGIGCTIACLANAKLSHERNFVNVVMSDNKPAMQDFRDFLAQHHITNVATDSYTRDWDEKTITVTAYADTKEESRLIDKYLSDSPLKFKRVIHNT